MSLLVAGFATLLAVGLIFGAQTTAVGLARVPYAIVIFGMQALFVLAFTLALRPPGVRVVAPVGLVVAAAADVAATLPREATIVPLGYLAAGGFLAAVVGQLLRREGRLRVTESLSSSVLLVLGVLAFASLIVLTRLPSGTQTITVCLTAAGVAVIVARVADAVAPWPRVAPEVPRGALGVVLGAMLGTAAAGLLGSYLRGFGPGDAALFGMVTAAAAVVADLCVGYAEAGRGPADPRHRWPEIWPVMWIARHLQGPLAALAAAAPLAYLLGVVFLVPRYM